MAEIEGAIVVNLSSLRGQHNDSHWSIYRRRLTSVKYEKL